VGTAVEESEDVHMNGFSYNEREKKIRISDKTFTVIWENVEKDVAEKAAELYGKTESIDTFLLEHNCKRFWGYNATDTAPDGKIE
jgi:hypothetical protein